MSSFLLSPLFCSCYYQKVTYLWKVLSTNTTLALVKLLKHTAFTCILIHLTFVQFLVLYQPFTKERWTKPSLYPQDYSLVESNKIDKHTKVLTSAVIVKSMGLCGEKKEGEVNPIGRVWKAFHTWYNTWAKAWERSWHPLERWG